MQFVDSYPQFAGNVDVSQFDYERDSHDVRLNVGPGLYSVEDLVNDDNPLHAFAATCDADARDF